MRRLILISIGVTLYLGFYGITHWRKYDVGQHAQQGQRVGAAPQDPAKIDSLPALDAHRFNGIQEIARSELVTLMTKFRPLSPDGEANLNRGCPGLACVYQGLGLKRWPKLAPGTVAFLNLKDALGRRCPSGQENFVFLKQGWWVSDGPPLPNATTGQVSVNSVTRVKPGLYAFNYAVYFPSTATYAWINHRNYGFPIEATGQPYNVTHCHCLDCRRSSGAPFVTWASFSRSGLRLTAGRLRERPDGCVRSVRIVALH
jgi:Glutathione-dependent formaldehyde-activating enzyme